MPDQAIKVNSVFTKQFKSISLYLASIKDRVGDDMKANNKKEGFNHSCEVDGVGKI